MGNHEKKNQSFASYPHSTTNYKAPGDPSSFISAARYSQGSTWDLIAPDATQLIPMANEELETGITMPFKECHRPVY